MSRHEFPTVGAELLDAVSACLAVLKTHLTSDDPKVSLRAASELTKLLAVCARNGIELGAGEAVQASGGRKPPVEVEEAGGLRPPLADVPLAGGGGGDDYAVQLNHPPAQAPVAAPAPLPARPRPFAPPERKGGPALPVGRQLTSFLGTAASG